MASKKIKNLLSRLTGDLFTKKVQNIKPKNDSLNLNEYDGKEFSRTMDDTTDKTKPFDNLETKIYHPELKEQYEKRKDIFHTKETDYIIKENKKKDKSDEIRSDKDKPVNIDKK
jgi:hypothetical protein